ncbi:MAG: Gfo/Idh/MocA family oxidoreductase [Rhodobacter sp.]|nr:Gfo/Idh/MocA family oxidoreductase [Rhodobacter sp.]
MAEVRVAGLGAPGWMGKMHSMARQTVPHFMGTAGGTAKVVALVADNPKAAADLAMPASGARVLTSWHDAVQDPEVDLIDICLPDTLHNKVAKAAGLAGKHVCCKRPVAGTAARARESADIAAKKGLVTWVGHAFARNPVHDLARDIIANGEIGEIRMFKACQHDDTGGNPLAPSQWRADGKPVPTGFAGDTGTPVFGFMGLPVRRVSDRTAGTCIVAPRRPVMSGLSCAERAVLTGAETRSDVTRPEGANFRCGFANAVRWLIDFCRIATGCRSMRSCGVYGTRGHLPRTDDKVNRPRLCTHDAKGRRRLRGIDAGRGSDICRGFRPVQSIAAGCNKGRIIGAAAVIRSVTAGQPIWPLFGSGPHICQIADACMESSRPRPRVSIT